VYCTACHRTNDLNSGEGSVRIEGLPANWSPGRTYTLRVVVSHPTAIRFGFQLSAIGPEGDQAGSLVPAEDGRTFVQTGDVNGKPIQFIEHNSVGSTIGNGNEFRFTFQAPADPNFGPIKFNVAGNAANGNGANTGDFIYATETTVAPLTASSEREFALATRGSSSMSTDGANSPFAVGFARLQNSGSPTPGVVFVAHRQANTLITEPAFPASSPIRSGRIYTEMNAPVNTGLALANPNSQAASVSVVFTDANGLDFSPASFTIPPNSQVAAFLHEPPFSNPNQTTQLAFTEARTFTFSSNVPIAATAVRTRINERGEFMMIALPVADLSATATSTATSIPHFADGGNWSTEILLINNGATAQSGTIRFISPAGLSLNINVDGQANTQFQYVIPGRSSRRFRTAGTSGVVSGWVEVAAASGSSIPMVSAVLAARVNNVTTSETSLNATAAGNAFRAFADSRGNFASGEPGSMQSGVVISNPGNSPITASVEATNASGSVVGSTTVSIPSRGQSVLFLNDVPGSALSPPFTGIMWVSAPAGSAIAVTGVRARRNERRDYLLTAYTAFDEAIPVASDLMFAQIVDSSDYSTQFALIGARGAQSTGALRFFTPSGASLNLSLK
jgi:hypothetical protein